MRGITVFFTVSFFALLINCEVWSQDATSVIRITHIHPYRINVGYSKTSNIIFPYSVRSIDRGSNALLVQKAEGADNIIQLKAGLKDFDQTNLSVVTNDGSFYSFVVSYASEPHPLNILFLKDSKVSRQPVQLSGMEHTEAELRQVSDIVKRQSAFLKKGVKDQKLKLRLQGIYFDNNILWFSLQLRNKSLIPFVPGKLTFAKRDTKKIKRTAQQELSVEPIYIEQFDTVQGKSKENCLFAFPAFTLPKAKELLIRVGEMTGGRLLLLRINPKDLLKARLLDKDKVGVEDAEMKSEY